jgi:hypothetical protein
VLDEGQTWHGTTRTRDRREGPAARYQYTTEVTGIRATAADQFLATGRLTGNFPGGTADLNRQFTLAGDRIGRLEIAP